MTDAVRPAMRPLVLVRGFGGVDVGDEQQNAYQGFNTGTVYPGKRGDNYIYEGFVLRALKSPLYRYRDATNVVGFYAGPVKSPPPQQGDEWGADWTSGTVAVDPRTSREVLAGGGAAGTIWIYRYYDLSPRTMAEYGAGLVRLLEIIRAFAERAKTPFSGVDIVAHSMGGLVVRNALAQLAQARGKDEAERLVHRVVTLGTPHRGIAFQIVPDFVLSVLPKIKDAADEMIAFDPDSTAFNGVAQTFDPGRILTVVGTNYRTYGKAASFGNRLATLFDSGTLEYNRSDGLVKQASAQLPGSPRTFVHKCHGGNDSLVTSREAFEIAMRFFHATHKVSLWLDVAEVTRGGDLFGSNEFFFGVSIKPRGVDFDLFHQSSEAENCYGPFDRKDLLEGPRDLQKELREALSAPGDDTMGWAGEGRLVWEGWIDRRAKASSEFEGMVFRLDVYVGERDSFGVGFSDNVIFRKQYYVQVLDDGDVGLFVHTGEEFLGQATASTVRTLAADAAHPEVQQAGVTDDGDFTFDVAGTGFRGTFRVRVTPDPAD